MYYRGDMTTNHGAPVINDTSSKTIGEGGMVLLGDHWFIEKISHFNRERIPERMAFCKGVGAHGYFEATEAMEEYTRARFLRKKGVRTPIFARFSMMFAEKGSPDTSRDVLGLELKFYTEEGNLNLLLTNIPVTPIRDMMNYPDLIHAKKASPLTGIEDVERFFDFYTGMPEMTNWLLRFYSNQGTRKSYRKSPYYSMGTYLFHNAGNMKYYVRFTLLPKAGTEEITWEEAEELAAREPDVSAKDFYQTLYQDNSVEFNVCIQMREAGGRYMGNEGNADVVDGTKRWEEEQYPLYIIGKLVINRPPQNYFAEVEQAAFSLNQCVPGIYISNDRLLQGLAFSTTDENRYRLGSNYMQLPINSPKVPVVNNHQNGSMCYYANRGRVNYKPNMLDRNEPQERLEYLNTYPDYFSGYAQRVPVRSMDDYKQAARFYQQLSGKEQEALIRNLRRELGKVDDTIRNEVLNHLGRVDERLKHI